MHACLEHSTDYKSDRSSEEAGANLASKLLSTSMIQAWDCVPDEAISAADHILAQLLQHTPPHVLQRLVDVGAHEPSLCLLRVIVVGR